MFHRWGEVESDTAAEVIATEHQTGTWAILLSALLGIGLIAFAVWFGMTGKRAALACLIVDATCAVNFEVAARLRLTHTMVVIAERRIRQVEGQLNALKNDISNRR